MTAVRAGAGPVAGLAVVVLTGLAAGAAPAAAGGDALTVPSGQPVSLLEVLSDGPTEQPVYRFRFVAPEIGGGLGFDRAAADMAHLCRTYALPRLAALGPAPAQVVISLSDRPLPFGETAPEAVQFFEVYRPEGEACIWEGF